MGTRSGNLQARFIEFCVSNGLFRGRRRVLAAVSGGADSILLMHMLHESAGALAIEVAVGHVNHRIRPEAGEDEAFVRNAAAELGLPFVSASRDVPALAAMSGESLEAAARTARYELLRDMAGQIGCDAIATGHSMTDQAETLLMRMIRGTGPLGLAGIAATTGLGVVRPLLCMTSAEIRAHAADRGWEFVQDATNFDDYYLRNRIRSQLLPMLLDFNPRIESLLSGLADDAAALSSLVDELVRPMVSIDYSGNVTLNREPSMPPALAGYAIRQAFQAVTGEPLGLSRTHIDALVPMLSAWEGPAELHLPRRVVVHSVRAGLVFSRDLEGPPPGSSRRGR
jgi:tRNA(Ile)-lysidine synthase